MEVGITVEGELAYSAEPIPLTPIIFFIIQNK